MKALMLCVIDKEYLCNFLLTEKSDLYKIFNSCPSILNKEYQYYDVIKVGKDEIKIELLLEDIRKYANLACNETSYLDSIFLNKDESAHFQYYWLIKKLKNFEFWENIDVKDHNLLNIQISYII